MTRLVVEPVQDRRTDTAFGIARRSTVQLFFGQFADEFSQSFLLSFEVVDDIRKLGEPIGFHKSGAALPTEHLVPTVWNLRRPSQGFHGDPFDQDLGMTGMP